jgi:hypothetical protein
MVIMNPNDIAWLINIDDSLSKGSIDFNVVIPVLIFSTAVGDFSPGHIMEKWPKH